MGKLNFLTHTRPDLAYTVQNLSQIMQTPRIPHYQALLHNIQYIGYTANQGILMNGSDELTLSSFLRLRLGFFP